MGISYIHSRILAKTHKQGECQGDSQEVMLRVALEDLPRDPLGRKEGKRGAKI